MLRTLAHRNLESRVRSRTQNYMHVRYARISPISTVQKPEKSAVSLINFNDAATSFRSKSFMELIRAYCVFQSCRIRTLVTHSESMIRMSYITLGDNFTDFVLKKTFFGHFCAGEDTLDMKPTIDRLENAGIGSILDYAAEADIVEDDIRPLDEDETKIKSRVYDYHDEELCDIRAKVFESCIRSAHALQQGQSTADGFAAIKLTALGNPLLLERISTAIVEIRNLFLKFDTNKSGFVTREEFRSQYEIYFTSADMSVDEIFESMDGDHDDRIDYVEWSNSVTIEQLHNITAHCINEGPLAKATLTEEERQLLADMRKRINLLADIADELDVKLMVDAEHTYFQPAIDNIVLELMKKYNRQRPLIFGTYQMYLTDSYRRLLDDTVRAEKAGYHFAAKLVRGAYMELERNRAKELGIDSPIQPTKEDTHRNYNEGMCYLIDLMAEGKNVQLMIASHNQTSIELCLQRTDHYGLGPEANIYFGQLLGMADHLTYALGNAKYRAYKYVPYGKVKEVMPYLIRRAQENSDMLGGVGVELRMLEKEITRRLKIF